MAIDFLGFFDYNMDKMSKTVDIKDSSKIPVGSRLEEFDKLIALNLKVTPLSPGTKVPMLTGWTLWNHGLARQVFALEGLVNFGLVLGEIMDVEGDSEEANAKILELIGDYHHPCYSSRKSIHHLFISPQPKITIIKKNHIEFRGLGHQSVMPPSTLISGVRYEWIQRITGPIPPMPPKLLRYFWSLADRGETAKPGHIQTKCQQCQSMIFMNKVRLELEMKAVRRINKRWACNKCRDYDLRDMCRTISKTRDK